MQTAVQSAGLTFVSFALLISVIVFFHEMGHLLVGKLFGVKVLRFSIGFGPRLFGVTWGETEYRVSLLPLGGYVKFAGDTPGEELEAADRGRGFLEQPAHRKAAIAFAGPVFNFLLALVLYVAINLAPHRDLSTAVGYVKPGSPAAVAGILSGDRIAAVDGEPVEGFLGLQEKIRGHAGRTMTMALVRDGQTRTVTITPAVHEEKNPIETVKQGRIGIGATPRAPEIGVVGPDTPAGRAGLRTFDVVTALDGQPIASYEELVRRLGARGETFALLRVLRRRPAQVPGGTLWVQEPLDVRLPLGGRVQPAEGTFDRLAVWGLESADLNLFAVQPGSAADRAGLRPGDRIVSVQGKPAIWWFDEVETARKAAGAGPLALGVRRDGGRLDVVVSQDLHRARDEAGVRVQVPELGAAPDSAVFAADPERIWIRFPPGEAVRRGFDETVGAVRGLALGIARIVTGDISSEAIGGPLMIADVARKAADDGWQTFVYVMAMISVNLGLMNLIPLPVLDGFHVLSAAIEAVRRRPLSLRFREIANVVGLALVTLLMLFALKNDAVRKFFD